jgi:hypothetical protein
MKTAMMLTRPAPRGTTLRMNIDRRPRDPTTRAMLVIVGLRVHRGHPNPTYEWQFPV